MSAEVTISVWRGRLTLILAGGERRMIDVDPHWWMRARGRVLAPAVQRSKSMEGRR